MDIQFDQNTALVLMGRLSYERDVLVINLREAHEELALLREQLATRDFEVARLYNRLATHGDKGHGVD